MRKITGKAVLVDLNCKIFFVSQPWWLTEFWSIYSLHIPTDCLEFEMMPKCGIIWSRWPLGFKMLFIALMWYYELTEANVLLHNEFLPNLLFWKPTFCTTILFFPACIPILSNQFFFWSPTLQIQCLLIPGYYKSPCQLKPKWI